MTGVVDVIVDRDDDLATAHAIHNLAAREPTVLAVSIAPDWRDSPAAIWAILRALGKRTEHLDVATLSWQDTQRWITAHQITELVILRAQHLKERTIQELKWHLVARAGITLRLLYSGHRAIPSHPTTTITDLLARPRPAPFTSRRQADWPSVPRSHPLRLRYDCSQRLHPKQFRRVDELLAAAFTTLNGWLLAHRNATSHELRDVISVLTAAHDPNQAYVRRCGVAITLMRARIAIPRARTLSLNPRSLTAAQISAVLAYTDRAAAGYLLAELITGLPPDLLELVGGDQITDDAILGCPVPEPARPVLRAVNHDCWPVLDPPTPAHGRTVRRPRSASRPLPIGALDADAVATATELLLRGPGESIAASELTSAARGELDGLAADEILELEHGIYRASCIALYSCYEDPLPPLRLRATDIHARRSADIS